METLVIVVLIIMFISFIINYYLLRATARRLYQTNERLMEKIEALKTRNEDLVLKMIELKK